MNQKGGNIFGLFFIFFIIGALVFLLMWISQNPVEIPLFLGLALPIVAIGIFVMLFGVLWGLFSSFYVWFVDCNLLLLGNPTIASGIKYLILLG